MKIYASSLGLITLSALGFLVVSCGGSEKSDKAGSGGVKQSSQAQNAGTGVLPADSGPAKEIIFPSDRIVGMVHVRPAGSEATWSPLTDARDKVRLPSGSEVKLDLTGYNVADLSFLADLHSDDIQELVIERCNVADTVVGSFDNLRLKGLSLNGNPITDEALNLLAGMNTLEKLALGETGITDNGLSHLASLTRIKRLWLQKTAITDAGLAHLAGLSHLESLVIYDTNITDQGIVALKDLPRLRRLGLRGTKVTDSALPVLAQFPALEEVDVTATAVTEAAAKSLREANSRISFIFNME